MHAAFAMLVGFAECAATGRGCLLEVTMVEGALNAAVEVVLEATAYGKLRVSVGIRSPNVAPQGLYACRGDDQWLAISVVTDQLWRARVRALRCGDEATARLALALIGVFASVLIFGATLDLLGSKSTWIWLATMEAITFIGLRLPAPARAPARAPADARLRVRP